MSPAWDTVQSAVQKGENTDLEGKLFPQVLEKNGGDDGTRTRGLCRDRALVNQSNSCLDRSESADNLVEIIGVPPTSDASDP